MAYEKYTNPFNWSPGMDYHGLTEALSQEQGKFNQYDDAKKAFNEWQPVSGWGQDMGARPADPGAQPMMSKGLYDYWHDPAFELPRFQGYDWLDTTGSDAVFTTLMALVGGAAAGGVGAEAGAGAAGGGTAAGSGAGVYGGLDAAAIGGADYGAAGAVGAGAANSGSATGGGMFDDYTGQWADGASGGYFDDYTGKWVDGTQPATAKDSQLMELAKKYGPQVASAVSKFGGSGGGAGGQGGFDLTRALPGLISAFGSMQQGDTLQRIADRARADRAPFLGKANEWLAGGPEAYAAGPGAGALKGVLAKLSASGGNPIGSGTALSLATEAGLNDWRSGVTGMANLGLGGEATQAQLSTNAANAGNIFPALGDAAASVFGTKDSSLAEILKKFGVGANNIFTPVGA